MGWSLRRTVRGRAIAPAHLPVFLSNIYPVEFNAGNRKRVFSSMAFAGTVLGQLTFGYLVDRTGRKAGMMLATAIV